MPMTEDVLNRSQWMNNLIPFQNLLKWFFFIGTSSNTTSISYVTISSLDRLYQIPLLELLSVSSMLTF